MTYNEPARTGFKGFLTEMTLAEAEAKLRSISRESSRLKLIYEWVKTDKVSLKEFLKLLELNGNLGDY